MFADGRVIDGILLLVAAEALLLLSLYRRTGRGVLPRTLVANLLAGSFLLLALRFGLLGWGWPAIALCLLLSLLAHLADLRARWQG